MYLYLEISFYCHTLAWLSINLALKDVALAVVGRFFSRHYYRPVRDTGKAAECIYCVPVWCVVNTGGIMIAPGVLAPPPRLLPPTHGTRPLHCVLVVFDFRVERIVRSYHIIMYICSAPFTD